MDIEDAAFYAVAIVVFVIMILDLFVWRPY
jgi:hypothetical protein